MRWAILAFQIAFAACIPLDHADIPDKGDPPSIYRTVYLELPTPTPTPEPSACEYEVIGLKSELEAAYDRLGDEPECVCD